MGRKKIAKNTEPEKGDQQLKEPGIMAFFKKNLKYLLILWAVIGLTYVNTIPNAFVSDDTTTIVYNKDITSISKQFKYQSLNGMLLAINYALTGTHASAYHVVNITLHLLVASLVFYLLFQLFSREIAFLTSLVFAVHPLNAEAVSWISGRVYPLYSLFIILALCSYIKARRQNNYWQYLACAGFFLLGFSTNVFAVSFPLFIILYELSFGNLKKSLRPIAVFIILTIARVLLYLTVINERVSSLTSGTLQTGTSLTQNIVASLISFWSYIYLFIFPKDLSFYHEDISSAYQLKYLLIIITTLFLAALFIAYKKSKLIFFSLGFYAVSLAPILIPIKVGWIVAERYSYLGTIGLSLFTVYVIKWVFNRLTKNSKYFITAVTIIALVLAVRTFIRNFDWKDEDSLWLATVKTSPTSSKAWNNMGDYYGRHGDMPASFNAFVKATQINPTYSDAWHNAGNALVQMGKDDESIPYFEKSLQFNPNLIEAYNNLAIVYQKKGDGTKAYKMINKSLQINSNVSKTYAILAYIEYENKNVEKAMEALRKGLTIDPQNQVLQKNLTLLENAIQK